MTPICRELISTFVGGSIGIIIGLVILWAINRFIWSKRR